MKLLQLVELAAEIFEQLPKANLAHCHLMLKFAKWQMIDDEGWKIHDTTNKTNLANCHLTLTFVNYNIPANINTNVRWQWIIVPKAQNNTNNSQNKGT